MSASTRGVKVRIAVAVDRSGRWYCCGGSGVVDAEAMETATEFLSDGPAHYFLTAELAIPETAVSAVVERA